MKFPFISPLLAAPLLLLPASCSAQTKLATATSAAAKTAATTDAIDANAPFGALRLVDEILCGAPGDSHQLAETPAGISKIETLLGQPCRTLPTEGAAKSFAYRIGQGKGLKAGGAYVLSVEFPEDKGRSMFIVNRGAEMVRGVRTGQALGDVLYTYTNNNSESLKVPLSGRYRAWQSLFWMHDRTFGVDLKSDKAGQEGVPRDLSPADGFWVAITQSRSENDPMSAGAAVSRIRLYEVADPSRLNAPLQLPPAGLPQRHLFWREEMADGVLSSDTPEERGVTRRADWYEYKARLMGFLGMNTFSKDLLEFGHNQGWDSGPDNDWFNASHYPGLWSEVLDVMEKHKLSVLPYYEYTGGVGAKGLGKEKRAMPLSGAKAFTHISWLEDRNLDITDPDTLADAKRLLDATILRYKDRVPFVGAWFRPRPSQMPIGFADAMLARFAREANQGQTITREALKADKALLDRYYAWWFGKRREFLVGLRDHLRQNGIPNADILLTSDASEPGRSLEGPTTIVTDDVAAWTPIVGRPEHKKERVLSYDEAVSSDAQFKALTSPRGTWGEWEWQHSDPQADPQNYRTTPGALLTYSFNRAYSVSSPSAFNAFRTPSGLAAVLHYPLNELSLQPGLGYLASDMEYAGPYCMMSEARLMAYGDPRYLGYLAASSFNRGFPEYVRAFNAAFLSLPALPSSTLKGATPDAEIVVREIKTPKNGTYYAVVNVGLGAKPAVKLAFPAKGQVFDATTGKSLGQGALQLAMEPCQLRSFVVR